MSVMTIGIFWVGQQTQLTHFERADRNLVWIHIAFLCSVSLTPFSTSLLAEFIHYRTALLVYWFNIFLLGLMLYWGWGYASRTKLLAEDVSSEVSLAITRRILIAQSLYAAGAAFCLINVLQHRGHRSRATQLCHRSAVLLGTILAQVARTSIQRKSVSACTSATLGRWMYGTISQSSPELQGVSFLS